MHKHMKDKFQVSLQHTLLYSSNNKIFLSKFQSLNLHTHTHTHKHKNKLFQTVYIYFMPCVRK